MDPQLKKKIEWEHRIKLERAELKQYSSFNPFGKGGAGAPLRDKNGQVISSRKPGLVELGNIN